MSTEVQQLAGQVLDIVKSTPGAQGLAVIGLRYSLDLSHYVPRCTPCHRRFDRKAAAA